MATKVVWRSDRMRFRRTERFRVYLLGTIVLFAAFGMGEAVYRLLFLEFAGATDRIPIEAFCGLVLAWLATNVVGNTYRNRKETNAKLNTIWASSRQIRGALEAITPLAHPMKNQQSIRVIREELDKMELALKDIFRTQIPPEATANEWPESPPFSALDAGE